MTMRIPMLAAALAAFVTWSAPTLAQDFTAAELLEGLSSFIKKRNDSNAVGTISEISARFAGFNEKDQKAVVKAVSGALNKKRKKNQNELYIAALKALGGMGEEGAKALLKSLKNNNVKKRVPVLAECLFALSVHKNPKHIDTFVGFLKNSEPKVVAAAADSLGVYVDQPEKVRKKVVEELVKSYAGFASLAASRGPREPIFKTRLGQVERQMLASLTKLTGKKNDDAPKWQTWYNKNKKAKWGPLKVEGS